MKDAFNQGLGQPTSDNKHSVHAPYLEREHPLPCLTDVFPEVLILVNQSIQGCSRLNISLVHILGFSFTNNVYILRHRHYANCILPAKLRNFCEIEKENYPKVFRQYS